MRSPRSRLGQRAEIAAAAELGRRGYRIVGSNYRCKYGEVDLIAQEGGSLVFVEVRCRTTDAYGTPAESVTAAKRQRLVRTAQTYLDERNLGDVGCRFDVVEVCVVDGQPQVSEILRDAFCL